MVGRAHLAYLRLIGRASMTALTVILFAWAALQLTAIYRGAELRGEVGYDFGLYTDIGRHFLQTGEVYYQHQLAGPYEGLGTVNIYPPLAMYLFVPFAFLPTILWWAVPITIIAVSLYRLRPSES